MGWLACAFIVYIIFLIWKPRRKKRQPVIEKEVGGCGCECTEGQRVRCALWKALQEEKNV